MYIKHVIIGLFLLLAINIYGQFPYYTTHIVENDGLSSNYIKTMDWDASNRLWLGTDKGISIYDGHRFTYINGSSGLHGSYISQLLYDSLKQSMLFITSNRRLYRSDGQSLVYYPMANGYEVNSVEVSNGYYQLTAFAPGGKTAFFVVPTLEKLRTAVPALVMDDESAIHMRFGEGREIIIDENSVMKDDRFQTVKGTLLRKEVFDPTNKIAEPKVGEIIINSNEIIWRNKGMIQQLKVYSKTGWVFAANIRVAEKNAVVLRAPNTGSLLCLKEDGSHTYMPEEVTGVSNITQVLPGPGNTILVATLGDGLMICHPSKGKVMLLGTDVSCISPGSGGEWLVAGDQLFFYDHKGSPKPTGQAFHEPTSITEENGVLHCTSLLQYQKFKLDKSHKPVSLLSNYTLTSGISDLELMPGGGYALSTYSLGTILFNKAGKAIDTLQVRNGTLHDDIIEQMIHLKNGIAYTSFSNGVLIKYYDGSNLLIDERTGLLNNTVYDLYEEEGGNILWICTEDGLTRYSKNQYKQYGKDEGFIGKKCLGFFIDKKGRRFAVSDQCLMLLVDNKLHPLLSYPIKPQPDAYISTIYFDESKELLDIGSSKGIFELDISKIQPSKAVIGPTVYYIKTADSIISVLNKTAVLPPGGSAVDIVCGFEQVDFTGSSKLYYKIDGYDDEWLQVPANFTIVIPKLSAGIYDLKMYSVNADGYLSKPETVMQINKLYPWYLIKPLRILYAILAAFITWVLAQVWVRNRIRQKIQGLLIGQQMQQERNRISSELHDNVGSQLTNIIVQLDYVESALQTSNNSAALQKVTGLQRKARQAMNQLRESIWVLKEDAVKLPVFAGRIHRYALEIFDEAGDINFEIDSRVKKDIELTPWQAVNLLRILQEGFQNIQKHSEAKEVYLSILNEFDRLKIILRDNGKGFDVTSASTQGQGLNNMRQRVQEMGGNIHIKSNSLKGTTIVVDIPLQNNANKQTG